VKVPEAETPVPLYLQFQRSKAFAVCPWIGKIAAAISSRLTGTRIFPYMYLLPRPNAGQIAG
jgi:hypothetical protein